MHKRAGQIATAEDLTDIEELTTAYFNVKPDVKDPTQQVVFGTSGHRGTSLNGSFNEEHIRSISQAIAEYRVAQGVTGPLFIGADTHALSAPALKTAVETLNAFGVKTLTSAGGEFVPTPALSHAILGYNFLNKGSLADGVIITPSHNPPSDGGIKYNPPHGGPAETEATTWIAARANELRANELLAEQQPQTDINSHRRRDGFEEFDFVTAYVDELDEIVDLQSIAESKLRIAVHPLGGAAFAYWEAIKNRWNLNIDIFEPKHDPQWSFMTLDWDGKIRMDPSSVHAMATVEPLRQKYDLILANDADADRFGVVTKDAGMIAPNHMLAVAIDHLLATRGDKFVNARVGKTLVSSAMIDRIVTSHGRRLYEVPVGFKWFVEGLNEGTLLFGGEESAGASFLRKDGRAWSTDKDGIIMCLLAAEITALNGQSIAEKYAALERLHGKAYYTRVDAPATLKEKQKLAELQPEDITQSSLAGEAITEISTKASGNGASIGGLKLASKNAWFAARPSGTENVYKIYAESFKGNEHLKQVLQEAQEIVAATLSPDPK